MLMEGSSCYNPHDVEKYFGKTFVTENGSHYSITKEGKIKGRSTMEGAEVRVIAGIEEINYSKIELLLQAIQPELRLRDLDNLIEQYGKEIKPGLRLFVGLKPKYILEKGKYGVITSHVTNIF